MLATFWSSHDPNFWQPPSENGNDIEFQNLGVLLTFEKTPSNKKVFSHATLNNIYNTTLKRNLYTKSKRTKSHLMKNRRTSIQK